MRPIVAFPSGFYAAFRQPGYPEGSHHPVIHSERNLMLDTHDLSESETFDEVIDEAAWAEIVRNAG